MKAFFEKIKDLRHDKGITQKEAASYLGITKNALGNYETGIREPSFDTLRKICDLYDVSADYLIGRSDEY